MWGFLRTLSIVKGAQFPGRAADSYSLVPRTDLLTRPVLFAGAVTLGGFAVSPRTANVRRRIHLS